MADFDFKLDLSKSKFVKDMQKFLRNPRELLAMLGQDAVDMSIESIENQRFGTDGQPWQPRAVPNLAGIYSDINNGINPPKRRLDPTPALKDTGKLQQSFTWDVTTDTTVEWGTNRPNVEQLLNGGIIRQLKKIPDATFDKEIDKFLKNRGKKLSKEQKKRVKLLKGKDELLTEVPPREFLGYNTKRAEEVLGEFLKKKIG